MNNKQHNSPNFFRTDANDYPLRVFPPSHLGNSSELDCTRFGVGSRMYQHLYLRGNFKQEMFFDKVDMINVWNRLWLSAEATGTQILSAEILNNHFHLTGIFRDEDQRTRFKRHFRLSITQYHNRRYDVHGTLGTRTLKHAELKDLEDIKDCICYHLRNVLHHGISANYLDYPYSTARYVFDLASADQQGFYTSENLPENLARAYLPARVQLPKGWMMTREGLIVPPDSVFRKDLVEELFAGSRDTYLETLSHRTTREADDTGPEDGFRTNANDSRVYDEQIVEFVKENCRVPIPTMSEGQKMAAIYQIVEQFSRVNQRLLARLFGIPPTTLAYRLGTSHRRE